MFIRLFKSKMYTILKCINFIYLISIVVQVQIGIQGNLKIVWEEIKMVIYWKVFLEFILKYNNLSFLELWWIPSSYILPISCNSTLYQLISN